MSQQRLQIHLNIRGELGCFPSFLPVNVVDSRGQVLSTGAVSTLRATVLSYERDEELLFVRLILPNGTTETQSLQTPDHVWRDEVAFNIGDDVATSDWMAWSALRLDMKRQGGALLSQPGMRDAWFQLWEKTLDSPRWRQIPMDAQLTNLPRSQEAIQLELRHSPNPRALVVRLDSDIPQVVSLPSESTRVLVTSLRTQSGVVTPQVVIGGYSPNAEAIMEFLHAGKLNPVETMLDPGSELAHQLLRDKLKDPIAATAAAYYLLRKRDWDRLPLQWLDNLARWYEGIPDAKLIRAINQIERGMPMYRAANLAVETLSHFLDHGIPLFAEARSLLSYLLALAEKAEQPLGMRTAKTLRTMLASPQPAGLSFSFAGKAPDMPLHRHQTFVLQQTVLIEKKLRKVPEKSNHLIRSEVDVERGQGLNRLLREQSHRLRIKYKDNTQSHRIVAKPFHRHERFMRQQTELIEKKLRKVPEKSNHLIRSEVDVEREQGLNRPLREQSHGLRIGYQDHRQMSLSYRIVANASSGGQMVPSWRVMEGKRTFYIKVGRSARAYEENMKKFSMRADAIRRAANTLFLRSIIEGESHLTPQSLDTSTRSIRRT